MSYFFTSLDKTFSAEENDTKIVKIWLGNFEIHFLKIQVIFKFRWIFGTDERRILSGQTIHNVVLWKPIVPCFFCCHGINGLPQYTIWKVCPATILRSPVAKNRAKFENDRISRNGHRIKITEPNLMI